MAFTRWLKNWFESFGATSCVLSVERSWLCSRLAYSKDCIKLFLHEIKFIVRITCWLCMLLGKILYAILGISAWDWQRILWTVKILLLWAKKLLLILHLFYLHFFCWTKKDIFEEGGLEEILKLDSWLCARPCNKSFIRLNLLLIKSCS